MSGDCDHYFSQVAHGSMDEVISGITGRIWDVTFSGSSMTVRMKYEEKNATNSAKSNTGSILEERIINATANLSEREPKLSAHVLMAIGNLPDWDPKDKFKADCYRNFFEKYGSHYISEAAFGGSIYMQHEGLSADGQERLSKEFHAAFSMPTSAASRRADNCATFTFKHEQSKLRLKEG